jgi:hypothetical protein
MLERHRIATPASDYGAILAAIVALVRTRERSPGCSTCSMLTQTPRPAFSRSHSDGTTIDGIHGPV